MNESKHGKHSKVGVVSVTRFILHISVLLSLIRLSCFNFLWHSIQCFLAVNHTEATYVRTNLTFIIFRWWRFQNYKKNGRKANEKKGHFSKFYARKTHLNVWIDKISSLSSSKPSYASSRNSRGHQRSFYYLHEQTSCLSKAMAWMVWLAVVIFQHMFYIMCLRYK